jgi:hypothetical protein
MVALDSHAGLARQDVPVRLEPQPKGEWRWIGTRTLVFEPEGRFAMASEYRASVAAGVKSATGGVLASAVSWSFRTPPPRLLAKHPETGPARRDGLLFAAFDQRIEPAAVLASVRVRAAGAAQAVRLATAEELGQDEAVARLARAAEPGRWFAFRTEAALPMDAAVEVSIGPGAPSAEGSRRSESAERWSFRTYGPFRVRKSECGWNGRCTPADPWRIELTNPIDARRSPPKSCASSPSCRGSRSRAGATRSRSTGPRRAARATASRSRARCATPSASRSSPARRSRSTWGRRRARCAFPAATSS